MDQTAVKYEKLIEKFVKWAEDEESIRAAIVIGSRARSDSDEWADLDVIVITTDPKRLLSTGDWVNNIGEPVITFIEPTPTGDFEERRVLFKNGLDVDFAVIPLEVARGMLHTEIPPELAAVNLSNVFGRGMRTILDRDGISDQLRERIVFIEASSPSLPTQNEFLEVVNNFWYQTVWTAKHLRRGELWWAKSGCDAHLKWLLRRVIEWHARAGGHDTWFRGRFLEKWADPRAVKGLKDAFAHYDEDDIWRALLATMDLFRWLAVETAERLNYDYPTHADEYATKLVKELLAGKNQK
jgi:aminoglycoside 6-adenylyltransferase